MSEVRTVWFDEHMYLNVFCMAYNAFVFLYKTRGGEISRYSWTIEDTEKDSMAEVGWLNPGHARRFVPTRKRGDPIHEHGRISSRFVGSICS